jgi:hypothetical protein
MVVQLANNKNQNRLVQKTNTSSTIGVIGEFY